MIHASDSFVLAVDGGGTRCRLALSGGDQVWHVEVGAANVSTDFAAACVELNRGLAALAERAGAEVSRITDVPAYLGLAGITGQPLAERLAAVLPFSHVRIEDDRLSALRGALGTGDGFVAHCGTGSFLAVQQGGRPSFAGGRGPVLGDEASAQWVGRRALSQTLECVDGLSLPSDLSAQILSRFGDAAGMINVANGMSPTEFGVLAPLVTQNAAQGDNLAVSIMLEGAGYLADRMVKMGWTSEIPICLTGGIGQHYAAYLPEDMQQALTRPLGDPMSGAIALAHAFQEENEHERY